MKRTRAVFKKELTDGVRDRRSLFSVLLYPLVGPTVVVLTLNLVSDEQEAAARLTLPVAGIENAPGLVRFLGEHEVSIEPAALDPEGLVRSGKHEVALRIPADYGELFRAGKPASVELIVDRSRQSRGGAAEHARALLEAYSGGVGAQRLLARGLAPDLPRPLEVKLLDLASPKERAALVLGMIPVFLLLGAFMGGMNVATDATAGERERNSLEPLLINPVPRAAIVLGKWLATSLFAFAALVLTLGFTVAALAWLPGDLGVRLVLGPSECWRILVILTPLCFFFAALQLTVATFARSFKEAQAYLSFLVFVPMLPGLALTFKNIPSTWFWVILPGFGQELLVRDVMRDGHAASGASFLAAGATSALAVLLAFATTRLLRRERIVFGR